jgi:hypothetical protein
MFHQLVSFGQANTGLAHFQRATSLDQTAEEFDQRVKEILARRDPPATTFDPHAVAPPLLYEFTDKDRFGASGGLLNVFDFAGATMTPSQEGTRMQDRALSMDGFLYFLDPTSMLPPDHPVSVWYASYGGHPGTPEEQNRVLQHFLEKLRTVHRIPPSKPIKAPVAVCITKIDLLPRPGTNDIYKQFIDELLAIGLDEHGPTLATIRKRHQLILKYREVFFPGWRIEQQLDELFAGRFSFFPISSVGFGELGEPDRRKRSLQPFGIVEPVLWLLHMNGYKVLS